MKIWILRPQAERIAKPDPWVPWYDKSFGFIIQAPDEAAARAIAEDRSGDESREIGVKVWLDEQFTSCVELQVDEAAGPSIIMMDFHAA